MRDIELDRGYIVDPATGRRIKLISGGSPTWLTDMKNGAILGSSLTYQARTGSANGTGVDLQKGHNQAFFIITMGAYTDGTHTISAEESKNDNSADAGGAADAYAATDPAVAEILTSAKASSVVVVNVWRSKRYLRAVTTVAGSPNTGAIYGVLVGSQKAWF